MRFAPARVLIFNAAHENLRNFLDFRKKQLKVFSFAKKLMQPIKEIIQDVFKNLSKGQFADKSILEAWQAAAGEESKKTDIVGWKEGVLKINVDSSARLFKLNLKKSQLIKEIRKEISSVEQIVFRVGKISKTRENI